MPSESLSVLLCYSGFRLSATFVLRYYGSEYDFISINYLDWDLSLLLLQAYFLTTNILLSRDIVHKESVTGFKKCQRTK